MNGHTIVILKSFCHSKVRTTSYRIINNSSRVFTADNLTRDIFVLF